MCSCEVCRGARKAVDNIFQILKIYGWILDSYIIDFYQDDLWSRLPSSWRNFFKSISIEELGAWILNQPQSTKVWPLSLLALRQSIKLSTIDRNPSSDSKSRFVCSFARRSYEIIDNSEDFKLPQNDFACKHKNLFTKHIKIKKRYEIEKFSEICAKYSFLTKCRRIVDTGAGMGHLSRQLSYKYNLSVICVEQTKELSDLAKKYDQEYLVTIKKHLPDFSTQPAFHLCAKIDPEDSSHNGLVQNINEIFGSNFEAKANEEEGFGLIGLHPCGDLAVTLLKLYVKQPNVKFISIVGCCYMKLTTSCEEEEKSLGYPLSNYLINKSNNYLSYAALEVACHAVENYCDKMKTGDYDNLKVHAYRGMLEMLLIKKAGLIARHGRVNSVKVNEQMTFKRYCELATAKFDDDKKIFESDYNSEEVENWLDRWQEVVAFEALRMMLAPLVETVVLFDRFLFLSENDLKPFLRAEFDPRRSPRHHRMDVRIAVNNFN